MDDDRFELMSTESNAASSSLKSLTRSDFLLWPTLKRHTSQSRRQRPNVADANGRVAT